MRFKIKEIGDGGLPVEVTVGAAWLAAECPDLDARPGPRGVRFRGRLVRSGEEFFLHGELTGSLTAPCARCLEPAMVAIDETVDATWGDEPGHDDDGDDDVRPLDGDEIDAGAPLRDEILLAMPVSPLCRPDCKGLCAVCGGNRNTAPCDCEERRRNAATPLAALGKIKLQ